MIKKIILNAVLSFHGTAMLHIIISLVISCVGMDNHVPMLDAYMAFFPSESVALLVEILLVGVIGATFGACAPIFEIERWSFLKQGVVHFLITTAVWLPISIFVWAIYKYPAAIISTAISYSFVYGVTWIMSAIKYNKMVKEINKML